MYSIVFKHNLIFIQPNIWYLKDNTATTTKVIEIVLKIFENKYFCNFLKIIWVKIILVKKLYELKLY